MAEPPSRPRSLTRGALGFRRQPAVSWLNPGVLVGTALRAMWTNAFGSFLDKRELEEAFPAKPDTRYAERDELWLDYVADTGDGFDATYSVAHLLARRELQVASPDPPGTEPGPEAQPQPGPLRRGDVLVLGGDQVYPTATTQDYTNRFTGPFRAALPWTVDEHPTLLALPGNHDWYDGLTGFQRLFAQGRWIGGWKTGQSRSYFSLQLPHRWWFWGMDILADEYIDRPQLHYFSQTLALMEPGDRLILAVAAPTWVDARNVPELNRNLAYVENGLLRPHGIDLRLTLAGNLHHYSRYSPAPDDGHGDAPPAHKITSGGGGAFLHPTHDLPRRLDLPEERGATTVLMDSAGSHHEQRCANRSYELSACYPSRRWSRLLALRAMLLGVRNPGFMVFAALANVTLLGINQFGLRTFDREGDAPPPSFVTATRRSDWTELAWGLVRNPISGLVLLALAVGLVAMVRTPLSAKRRWQGRALQLMLGLPHAAAHLAVVVTVALVSLRIADRLFDGAWFVVTANVLDAVLGGVFTAATLGAYLAITNIAPWVRANGNEAFSAAGIEGYKNFLRMHIDQDGRLTVHAIGLDRVVRRWKADPHNDDPESSWLVPRETPLKPTLVDRITIE